MIFKFIYIFVNNKIIKPKYLKSIYFDTKLRDKVVFCMNQMLRQFLQKKGKKAKYLVYCIKNYFAFNFFAIQNKQYIGVIYKY